MVARQVVTCCRAGPLRNRPLAACACGHEFSKGIAIRVDSTCPPSECGYPCQNRENADHDRDEDLREGADIAPVDNGTNEQAFHGSQWQSGITGASALPSSFRLRRRRAFPSRSMQVTVSAAKIGARVGAVNEKARPDGI